MAAGDNKPKSARLAAMHESASALHRVGALGGNVMRHFDGLCLKPVVDFASEIEKKRKEKGESL